MADKLRRIHPVLLAHAREMRHPPTRAEARLWAQLRNRQLGGYKFRRQHPIDRFIVDFCCVECRVIVEVDGPSHTEPTQVEYDRARTEWLTENGYVLLRFGNDWVYSDVGSALEVILNKCQEAKAPVAPVSIRDK